MRGGQFSADINATVDILADSPCLIPLGQKQYFWRNRRTCADESSSNFKIGAMSFVHFRHRFFIRQYVYPLFCLLLLIVLIRWTTDRDHAVPAEFGKQYHEYADELQALRTVHRDGMATLLQPVYRTTASSGAPRAPGKMEIVGHCLSFNSQFRIVSN